MKSSPRSDSRSSCQTAAQIAAFRRSSRASGCARRRSVTGGVPPVQPGVRHGSGRGHATRRDRRRRWRFAGAVRTARMRLLQPAPHRCTVPEAAQTAPDDSNSILMTQREQCCFDFSDVRRHASMLRPRLASGAGESAGKAATASRLAVCAALPMQRMAASAVAL